MMLPGASLQVSIGQHSTAGRKALNQDSFGAYVPKEPELSSKGIVLAVADGISTSTVSQIASETAVKSFLDDYYCTSDAWSVPHAALQVLKASHNWLYAQSRNGPFSSDPDKGYVCTFSALILKQRHAHLLHVGDSRIYLLRNQQLEQLTRDHRVWRGSSSFLSQALGAGAVLEPDYQSIPLQQGDLFLLATDGLFEVLPAAELINLLATQQDLALLALQLTEAALAAGSEDNITLQLVRIDQLPADSNLPICLDQQLPLPPLLQPGDKLDGLQVIRPLQQSSRSHVYLVLDTSTEQLLVLKAPSIDLAEQPDYLERLMREEWIAKRVHSNHVVRPASINRPRTALYTLFEYVEGQTLKQWQLDHPSPTLEQVRGIIEQLGKGLQALHRSEILHQDIRPDNLMVTPQGIVKIIDFGAARLAGLQTDDEVAGDIPGTALYTAPEYFLGLAGTERSDLYSLAVLTYQLLSGRYPYGADVARGKSVKAQKKLCYQSVLSKDSELPVWLDLTLEKALQPDPNKRYQALSEFLYDLRHPNAEFQKPLSLIELHPLWFWQCLCVVQGLVILWLVAAQN
ncbi:bifunctional protein-serine/threonine kinase/phosphatase [Rheinheimera sp. MM224]|uniref:bifunctional protein-serine/threonine kinase/phosphatase n=1 Tax=Rheinheimera sp. MM224 TaxID=3019969 RepID=UPI0021F87874|nr:bifunctional protein-serine/threonine kinase/phosphatase [Rheinheimera sp. MM224]CAI3805799.1 Serine/threonine-protein kinase PknD [Rheinheimera sp. MM224]